MVMYNHIMSIMPTININLVDLTFLDKTTTSLA
jgi:hypothetical protein